jgi:DNA-binding transcriptional ArsR family regulator
MFEFHLRAADLAETSFAVSPLQETVFSLWVWRSPDRQPFHLPWRTAMLPRWRELDTEMLDAIVAPKRWVPDFLTPRPGSPLTDFATELAGVRTTTPRRVRRDLAAAYQGESLPPVLRSRPSTVLARMADALAGYWAACLQPSWPRIVSVLEADIVYRSRQLAAGGARSLFGDLDARVRWDDGWLYVDLYPDVVRQIEVDGRGMRLMPSLFCRGAVTYIDVDEPPAIVYPARGRGAVWEQQSGPVDGALAALIGPPRARLLTRLAQPATTSELARQLGVSASAVSQHLRALRDGRLVSRARSGRTVLYLRTELADQLIGSDPIDSDRSGSDPIS